MPFGKPSQFSNKTRFFHQVITFYSNNRRIKLMRRILSKVEALFIQIIPVRSSGKASESEILGLCDMKWKMCSSIKQFLINLTQLKHSYDAVCHGVLRFVYFIERISIICKKDYFTAPNQKKRSSAQLNVYVHRIID